MQFLNIEVVDDTALIDTSLISKGRISNNRRQESKTAIAMKKRPQKDWKIKKICAADKKGKKAAYSRAEMMALSLENVEDQTKKWSDVYGALAAPVAAEYDGLVAAARFDRRPLFMDNFSMIFHFILQFSFYFCYSSFCLDFLDIHFIFKLRFYLFIYFVNFLC